jgi:hypothetical protein
VVPKARPMPLQSLAQQTVSRVPFGIRRPLVKLARPARQRFRSDDRSRSASSSTLSASWVVGLHHNASGASGLNRNQNPASPTETLSVRAVRPASGRARRSCRPRSGLLSWGSSKIASPPVQMPCVHSQVGRGPPFGPKQPCSGLVPPLPFFPASAVYSARHPAGLLRPASGHGVRHVSGLPLPCARRHRAGARLSRWRSTLRSFPLRGRSLCVTAHRFPLTVGLGFRSWIRACCHARTRVLPPVSRPQGFAPPRSPLRLAGVATTKLPDAPLGLVPCGSSIPVPTAAPRIGGWSVPPWSEDRLGAVRGWPFPRAVRGSRALRRPARRQVGSASSG